MSKEQKRADEIRARLKALKEEQRKLELELAQIMLKLATLR